MSGTLLGLVAFGISAATAVRWYWLIQRVAIPRDRTRFLIAMAAGAAVGALALTRSPGWIGGGAALVAVIGGGAFCALRALSAQQKSLPAAGVGGPVLDFSAPDQEGRDFDLASLRGKPFLLKFFRGHW